MPASPMLALAQLSDERLAQLARDGDPRAFEAIVERYRTQLLAHARRITGDDAAEDALQHALACAWHSLQRRRAVRHVRAWLFKAVHRAALQTLRERHCGARALSDGDAWAVSVEEAFERSSRVRDALAAVAALPLREREALVAVSLDGRSTSELARELGIADGALRQLVFRARARARAASVAAIAPPTLVLRLRAAFDVVARRAHLLAENASGALPALAGPAAVGSALVLAGACIQAASGPLLAGGQHRAGHRAGAHAATQAGHKRRDPNASARPAADVPRSRRGGARDPVGASPMVAAETMPAPGSGPARDSRAAGSAVQAPAAGIPSGDLSAPVPVQAPALPRAPAPKPWPGPLSRVSEATGAAEAAAEAIPLGSAPETVERITGATVERAASATHRIVESASELLR